MRNCAILWRPKAAALAGVLILALHVSATEQPWQQLKKLADTVGVGQFAASALPVLGRLPGCGELEARAL